METLHCFTNGTDTVVARDEADALAVWREHTGERLADYPEMTFRRIDDAKALTIADDEHRQTLPAATEAMAIGRGFLCSTEV